MIIKKVIIENYQCYFGRKEFDFKDGLNIILGENGEGKTKFFEAIEWLFSIENSNLDRLISAKAFAEARVDDDINVEVSISIEQFEELCHISKSFKARKINKTESAISSISLEGIQENKKGERNRVDGKQLLDRVFPVEIRGYSMFKGEAELDIFKNEDALMNLIESFSSARHFEKYAVKGELLKLKAEKEVDTASRKDKKNKIEYERLQKDIDRIRRNISHNMQLLVTTEDQIHKTEEHIQEAERYVDNAEALQLINGRIKTIEGQIQRTNAQIKERYTTSLFDERWMLVNFESIHKEFTTKVEKFTAEKRRLQAEYDKQKGIEEGRKQATADLINNTLPLPSSVPSKAHMEEMLEDEICKVCNRVAKKGSDAYAFMQKRLEAYLKSQEPEQDDSEEDEELFNHDYLNRLFSLAVNHEDNLSGLRDTKTNIKELFEFNKARKAEIEEHERKLEEEQHERKNLIGSSSIGEDKLSNVLKNYNKWQEDIKKLNKDLVDYQKRDDSFQRELNTTLAAKESIDTESANNFLIKTRDILRDIEKIFSDTKQKKTDEFIELLQKKSNLFLEKINLEAFTGSILFSKRFKQSKTYIKIKLVDSEENLIHNPNQSLLTSMHISILFAISELASERHEESYPMIFDAPISSFGASKSRQFLNLVQETGNQKLLLIKNFIELDEEKKKLFIVDEFKNVKRSNALWVYLKRPFDKHDLKTLNSEIISL